MNSVQLVGRLTKDPELKQTASGTSYCKFSLAVDRMKDKNGNKETDFINCQAWGKQAEVICQYVQKGHRLGITGRIQTGKYQNKDGQTVYTTDVVINSMDFLEPRQQTAQPQAPQNYGQQYQQAGYQNDGYRPQPRSTYNPQSQGYPQQQYPQFQQQANPYVQPQYTADDLDDENLPF